MKLLKIIFVICALYFISSVYSDTLSHIDRQDKTVNFSRAPLPNTLILEHVPEHILTFSQPNLDIQLTVSTTMRLSKCMRVEVVKDRKLPDGFVVVAKGCRGFSSREDS